MASEYKPNFGVETVTASTITVRDDVHAGKVTVLNRAAGIAVTLPAATGSGAEYFFVVNATITSNSTTIKVASSADTMCGNAILAQDGGDTLVMFEAGATADTITFNGTTTGGVQGARVRLVDIASTLWFAEVVSAATSTEATPFSATV